MPFSSHDGKAGKGDVSISNSMKRSLSIALRWILFLTYAGMIIHFQYGAPTSFFQFVDGKSTYQIMD